MIYYGIFREDPTSSTMTVKSDLHRKVQVELETLVFKHWDGLSSSPAKIRPKPAVDMSVEGLALVSSTASGPTWPSSLLQKFAPDSAEAKELEGMKCQFEKEFPPVEPSPQTSSAANTAKLRRVGGQCDFSIEGGKEPIDVTRQVDLCVEAPPEPGDRCLSCQNFMFQALLRSNVVAKCSNPLLDVSRFHASEAGNRDGEGRQTIYHGGQELPHLARKCFRPAPDVDSHRALWVLHGVIRVQDCWGRERARHLRPGMEGEQRHRPHRF